MEKINLFNKRILYIGPVYFHYDNFIIKKFIELGALVETFELYPSSLYFKIIRILKLPLLKKFKKEYYNKLLLFDNFDFVLVRHGDVLEEKLLEKLRKINPNARFVNFHWDSIKPDYNYVSIIKYFDKVFSFDLMDCQTYENINYLQLFYIDEYANYRKNETSHKKEIDLLFIGSWRNEERYSIVKKTDKICKENQLNFFFYLQYSFRNQFHSFKKGIIAKDARNKSLTHKEILNYFSKSNCIIDFTSSFQTGLTIRTFETLGAGKKLITTNKNIINEPFYNPEYISIIDTSNIKLDIDFINKAPISSIDEMMENYSIKNYIYKLLQ